MFTGTVIIPVLFILISLANQYLVEGNITSTTVSSNTSFPLKKSDKSLHKLTDSSYHYRGYPKHPLTESNQNFLHFKLSGSDADIDKIILGNEQHAHLDQLITNRLIVPEGNWSPNHRQQRIIENSFEHKAKTAQKFSLPIRPPWYRKKQPNGSAFMRYFAIKQRHVSTDTDNTDYTDEKIILSNTSSSGSSNSNNYNNVMALPLSSEFKWKNANAVAEPEHITPAIRNIPAPRHYYDNNQQEGAEEIDAKDAATTRGTRKYFDNKSVVCNDGSSAGYYTRINEDSDKWLMYLEGGWFCHSSETCRERYHQAPRLMSSKFWPTQLTFDGILSNNPSFNPVWHDYNVIYIPYCSSDLWSGTFTGNFEENQNSFAFMGSTIIEETIKELVTKLINANRLIIMGTSAGGIGVVLNLDKIQRILRRATFASNSINPPVHVMGVADSAWFLEGTKSGTKHKIEQNSHVIGTLSRIIKYPENQDVMVKITTGNSTTIISPPLNSIINKAVEAGDENGKIRQKLHNSLNTKDDQLQTDDDNLYETSWTTLAEIHSVVQLPIKNVISGLSYWKGTLPKRCAKQMGIKRRWKCYFVHNAIQTLKAPLFVFQWLYDEAQMIVDNVGEVPIRKDQWDHINSIGERLRKSLKNIPYLFSPACISHGILTKKNWQNIKIDQRSLPDELKCWEEYHVHKKSYRWSKLIKRIRTYGGSFRAAGAVPHNGKKGLGRRRRKKNKHFKYDKYIRDNYNDHHNYTLKRSSVEYVQHPGCRFKLADTCRWPHCNQACPKLTNLKTGQPIDIIALLKSFGLNMTNVATALGIEPETLENMENDVIFRLFTNL